MSPKFFRFKISNGYVVQPGKMYSGGIGLTNIRKQLQLVYGDAHKLLVSAEQNRFSVSLEICLKDYQDIK